MVCYELTIARHALPKHKIPYIFRWITYPFCANRACCPGGDTIGGRPRVSHEQWTHRFILVIFVVTVISFQTACFEIWDGYLGDIDWCFPEGGAKGPYVLGYEENNRACNVLFLGLVAVLNGCNSHAALCRPSCPSILPRPSCPCMAWAWMQQAQPIVHPRTFF